MRGWRRLGFCCLGWAVVLVISAPVSVSEPALVPTPYFTSSFAPNAVFTKMEGQMRDRITARSGITLTLRIIAGTTTNIPVPPGYPPGGVIAANTQVTNSKGDDAGPYTTCYTALTPLVSSFSVSEQERLLAHEVFHCFEDEIMGKIRATLAPLWLKEGLADWVSQTVAPVPVTDQLSNYFRGDYLPRPTTLLFSRAYDAAGFWGHLQDSGIDLWHRLDTVLIAPSGDEAIYAAAVAGDEKAVLDSWGSSFLQKAAFGPEWTMHSPYAIPNDAKPPAIVPLTATDKVDAAQYSANLFQVVAPAATPIVHIQLDGYGRLGDTRLDTTELTNAWFCQNGSCSCPAGSTGHPPPTQQLGPQAYLGLAASGKTTTAQVTFETLEQYCKQKAEPPSGGSGGGKAASQGDPHLETLNGGAYDFQAAGEFTLLRSRSGDLDIQAREQPALGSTDVAWNTAIAMRAAGTRVEVDPGAPTVVLVDGRRTTLAPSRIRRLWGGGQLSSDGQGDVIVKWPDGSVADVFADYLGENVSFSAPPGVDGLTGLLAAWVQPPHHSGAPSASEVLIGGNGRRYRLDPESKKGFHTLYTTFADSWRITPQGSLFTYPAGKNTGSYTVPGFPSKQLTIASLPIAARATAKRTCQAAGVTNKTLLADCELDVAATGKKAMATATARLQTLAAAGGRPSPSNTRGASTLDPKADTSGAIVADSSGASYIAWDDAGTHGRPASVHFCKIPRGGKCTTPKTLPLPAANATSGISEPFPVLGAVPGVIYVVGPSDLTANTVIWTSTNNGASFSAPYAAPVGDYGGGTDVGDVLRDPGSTTASTAASSAKDSFDIASSDSGVYFSVADKADAHIPNSTERGFTLGHSFAADATLGFARSAASSQIEAYVVPTVTPSTIEFYREKGGANTLPQSWTGPVKVADGTLPRLASGPAGLFLLSEDYTSTHESSPTRLDVRKYDPTTHRFGPPSILTNDMALGTTGLLNDPGDIYDNPATGHLYVAWPGVRKTDGALVMRLWTSTNEGHSWSPPSDIAVIGPGYQGIPRLAVGDDGTAFLTFLDDRGLEISSLAALPG